MDWLCYDELLGFMVKVNLNDVEFDMAIFSNSKIFNSSKFFEIRFKTAKLTCADEVVSIGRTVFLIADNLKLFYCNERQISSST